MKIPNVIHIYFKTCFYLFCVMHCQVSPIIGRPATAFEKWGDTIGGVSKKCIGSLVCPTEHMYTLLLTNLFVRVINNTQEATSTVHVRLSVPFLIPFYPVYHLLPPPLGSSVRLGLGSFFLFIHYLGVIQLIMEEGQSFIFLLISMISTAWSVLKVSFLVDELKSY